MAGSHGPESGEPAGHEVLELSSPHPSLLTMSGASPGILLPMWTAGDDRPAMPELWEGLGGPGSLRAGRRPRAAEHHPATSARRPRQSNPERQGGSRG